MLYTLYQIVPNDNPAVFLALNGNTFTRIQKDKKLNPSKATKLIFDNERDAQCFLKQFNLDPNKNSIQAFLGNEKIKAFAELAKQKYKGDLVDAETILG